MNNFGRNRSMPSSQVIPELVYPDVSQASDWLCRTFGFSVRLRIANHRMQLTYGSGAVVLVAGSSSAESSGDAAHSIMARVENVDEHFATAQRAGARVHGSPTTYPYGERQYTAQDLAGHRWTFSQTVADTRPEEWGGSLATANDEGIEPTKALTILVAGPYRSGTNDDPTLIARNVEAMTETSLRLFRAGHLPVMGEWFALPLIERAGSTGIGDAIFDEIFHPIARRLVAKCDACLRIGGPSRGADEMVALAKRHGKRVFFSLEEVPVAS